MTDKLKDEAAPVLQLLCQGQCDITPVAAMLSADGYDHL